MTWLERCSNLWCTQACFQTPRSTINSCRPTLLVKKAIEYVLYLKSMGLQITHGSKLSRLIGSRIIESAAYCNQILLVSLYLNSTQNTSFNWIIWLLLSLLCWPEVILLSDGHCIQKQLLQLILTLNNSRVSNYSYLAWLFCS